MNNKQRRAELNKVIEKIEAGGQEVQLGSKRIRRPDYAVLLEERRLNEMEELNMSGGRTTVAVFDKR